jgi:predicted dehydrogenase
MNSLIVGTNFGLAVYEPVLKSLGFNVVTVDPKAKAMYSTLDEAISTHKEFLTVNICTPNYTHEEIARKVAPYAKIVFVEKPGVRDSQSWTSLVQEFPNTRILMVKNNQYRSEIEKFKNLSAKSSKVSIVWKNNNRIPNPGSWFTNKELAFGGVSRDLMPHMLSYYTCFADYHQGLTTFTSSSQLHSLNEIDCTDYGTVNKNGTYDVDDRCKIQIKNAYTNYNLIADWKSNEGLDEIYIDFDGARFPLGLCPESAYRTMIKTAIGNLENNEFWKDQYEQDLWIHRQLEIL